jgi:phage tail-like protein
MTESAPPQAPWCNLSLALDHYNRYPGEILKLFVQFAISEPKKAVLQISIPRVMVVEAQHLPEGVPLSTLSSVEGQDELILLVQLGDYFHPGQDYIIEVDTRVKTFYLNHFLLIDASLLGEDEKLLSRETVQLAIQGKGGYLQYLPEIYENDDFTGRFLMLIESFWKPIGTQIDQISSYFDPGLTPEGILPWLASWIGAPANESLPLNRRRSLLRSAMMFYQRRGTRQALKIYLEKYTGGVVVIKERRSKNFVLGADGRLGVEIALGTQNQPNSILITVQVLNTELERTHFTADMYRQKISEIVRTLVPAHTYFTLDCEFVDTLNNPEEITEDMIHE